MGIYHSLPDHHRLQLVLAGEVPWKVPFTPQVAHVNTSMLILFSTLMDHEFRDRVSFDRRRR